MVVLIILFFLCLSMRIILIGPPGSGKGTQAQWIEKLYHIPHITTGNLLRQAMIEKSSLGNAVEKFMHSGKLVPDNIIIAIVKEQMLKTTCQKGFILDGFPRTLKQAQALANEKIPIDIVLELNVSVQEVVKRLSGRLVHIASGRTYHTTYNPPKLPNQDDVTGEFLTQRDDDQIHIIRKRLEIYQEKTHAIANFYRMKQQFEPMSSLTPQFFSLAAHLSIEEVHQQIARILSTSRHASLATHY